MSMPDDFPWFVDELREINGSRFTPLSCLNRGVGVPYVIAAQWLYVPHFVEYRDGVFRVEDRQGFGDTSLRIVNDWYDYHGGDVTRVERIMNKRDMWGLFGSDEIVQYDDDGNFLVLAEALARMWGALLRLAYPIRAFRVEVFDFDEYGPQITFSSQQPVQNSEPGAEQGSHSNGYERRENSPGDFPRFMNELREINGPTFTPLAYISIDEAIPYVIAAQWLYVPRFVEYRGGLFRSVHPGGVVEENLGTVDDWFEAYDGDVSSVERTVNTLSLWDLFVGNDIGRYENDLLPMAMTIARAWNALLRVEFPDREFEVKILDSDAYGPQITFCSPSPDGQNPKWVPKVTEYAINRNPDGSVRGTSENGIPRPATPDEIPSW